MLIERDFAGERRSFRLALGELTDIETACGEVGIGAILMRLTSQTYFVTDILHVLRIGLRGGGMSDDAAKKLVRRRLDAGEIMAAHSLAADLLLSVLATQQKDELASDGDPATPIDWGGFLHSMVQCGVAPDQVRSMSLADFSAMMRAVAGHNIQPPTEAQFHEMLAQVIDGADE